MNLDCFIDGIGKIWNGFEDQYIGFKEFINLIETSELMNNIYNPYHSILIMVVDAYDIFFVCDEETIISKYLSFNTDIVISSEKYCWPDEYLYDKFPETNTHYSADMKFLNSGN